MILAGSVSQGQGQSWLSAAHQTQQSTLNNILTGVAPSLRFSFCQSRAANQSQCGAGFVFNHNNEGGGGGGASVSACSLQTEQSFIVHSGVDLMIKKIYDILWKCVKCQFTCAENRGGF